LRELRAKRVVKHPFPGIEFERQLNGTVVEVDEIAVIAPSDGFDIEQSGRKTSLSGGVLEIGQRAGILGISDRAGEMKVNAIANFPPCVDQALMERIELVGVDGKNVPFDSLLEPGPLKDRRLEDRSRRIRVILEKFRRALPVEAEIEAAVEAALVAVPAFADQRPEGFRDLKAAQRAFVAR